MFEHGFFSAGLAPSLPGLLHARAFLACLQTSWVFFCATYINFTLGHLKSHLKYQQPHQSSAPLAAVGSLLATLGEGHRCPSPSTWQWGTGMGTALIPTVISVTHCRCPETSSKRVCPTSSCWTAQDVLDRGQTRPWEGRASQRVATHAGVCRILTLRHHPSPSAGSPAHPSLQPGAGRDGAQRSAALHPPPTLINSHRLSFYFKHYPII